MAVPPFVTDNVQRKGQSYIAIIFKAAGLTSVYPHKLANRLKLKG